jgi:hypothetical protein
MEFKSLAQAVIAENVVICVIKSQLQNVLHSVYSPLRAVDLVKCELAQQKIVVYGPTNYSCGLVVCNSKSKR